MRGVLALFSSIDLAQLRIERHPSVHKLFLNVWGEWNHSRLQDLVSLVLNLNKTSCYMLYWCCLTIIPLTPHLYLYVLMRVSHIWVVKEGECYLECDSIQTLKTDLIKNLMKIREVPGYSRHLCVIFLAWPKIHRTSSTSITTVFLFFSSLLKSGIDCTYWWIQQNNITLPQYYCQ